MVSDGEQHPLASHPLETSREFDFADGEGVPEMETSVHVGVRKRSEPFGVFFLQFLHRLIRLKELCIRRNALWKRWRISVEEVAFLPVLLNAVLDVHQIVPLVGLYTSSAQVRKEAHRYSKTYLFHDYNRACRGVRVDDCSHFEVWSCVRKSPSLRTV